MSRPDEYYCYECRAMTPRRCRCDADFIERGCRTPREDEEFRAAANELEKFLGDLKRAKETESGENHD